MAFPSFLRIAVSAKKELVQVNGTEVVKKLIFDEIGRKFTEVLAHKLGFSYNLVTPSDGELGRSHSNGTWTGMVGMVQRGEADLAVSILSVSEQRLKVVDFSYPFYRVRINFATRKPEYTPEFTTLFKPFSLEVWIYTVVCILVMAVLFSRLLQKKYAFWKYVMDLYRTLLGQPTRLHPESSSDFLLMTSGIMGIMLVGYSYKAVLLAFLAIPPLTGISTIPELSTAVEQGRYQCTTFPGSFITRALVSSNDVRLKIIGENLQNNPGSKDVEGVLRNTKSSKIPAFIMDEDYFLPLKAQYWISKDELFPSLRAIAMQKDFCCKTQLDKVISYIWVSGIYNKLVADSGYIKSLKMEFHNAEGTVGKERKLSISDLKGLFILLLVGYALATITLYIEIIVGRLS